MHAAKSLDRHLSKRSLQAYLGGLMISDRTKQPTTKPGPVGDPTRPDNLPGKPVKPETDDPTPVESPEVERPLGESPAQR